MGLESLLLQGSQHDFIPSGFMESDDRRIQRTNKAEGTEIPGRVLSED